MPAPIAAAIGAGARAVGQAMARGTAMAARTAARAGATTAKHGGKLAVKAAGKAAGQGTKAAAKAGTRTAQHGGKAAARAGTRTAHHGGRATAAATRGATHVTGRTARAGPAARSAQTVPRTGSGKGPTRAHRLLDSARGRQHPPGRAGGGAHNGSPHHLGRAHPNGRVANLLRSARTGQRARAPRTLRQRAWRAFKWYRRGKWATRLLNRGRKRLDPRNSKFNRKRKKARKRLRRLVLAPLVANILLILLPLVVGLTMLAGAPDPRMLQRAAAPALLGQGGIPPALLPQVSAMTGIPTCAGRTPPRYGEGAAGGCVPALESYSSAGAAHGVDWTILAGIGALECSHGRSTLPGCSRRGTVNVAGARGPMQFLGSTWRFSAGTFDPDVSGPPIPEGRGGGYASDGNDNGVADPWEWPDATHAAARYLLANGLERDQRRAIFAYNRSSDYVSRVQSNARRYRTSTASLNLPASAAVGPRLGGTRRHVDPGNTARMQRVIDEVVATFGRGVGIGCLRPGDPQDHGKGRACDYMLSSGGRMPSAANQQHGHRLAQWLITHHRRLGVRYIIWQQKIWHVNDPHWRHMEDRGSLTQNHFDHVHISVQP